MKYLMTYSFIILLLSLTSCDKNDFEPDYSQGKATALKNGVNWTAIGRGAENNQGIGFDFNYEVFDDLGQLRQSLSFRKIPEQQAVYNLFDTSPQSLDSIPGCSFYTISYDGDVLEDIYTVVEAGNESTLTVTDYNENQRLLTGEFRVKLSIDTSRPKFNPSNPDTILFEVGEFEVRIED